MKVRVSHRTLQQLKEVAIKNKRTGRIRSGLHTGDLDDFIFRGQPVKYHSER